MISPADPSGPQHRIKGDTGDPITKSNTDSSVVQAFDDQIMSVFAEHL